MVGRVGTYNILLFFLLVDGGSNSGKHEYGDLSI